MTPARPSRRIKHSSRCLAQRRRPGHAITLTAPQGPKFNSLSARSILLGMPYVLAAIVITLGLYFALRLRRFLLLVFIPAITANAAAKASSSGGLASLPVAIFINSGTFARNALK